MTPLSLRIARLALAGAAAAATGCLVYILAISRTVSTPLAGFALAAALFVLAARSLAADSRRGRLLAVGGGLVLGGVGVLAAFGAGNLTLPAAALGVLAAWAAVLHPPRRPFVLAFALYVAIGIVILAGRGPQIAAFPWLLASALLWPWTSLMFVAGSSALPIYASIGAGVALAVAAFTTPQRRPVGLLPLAVALGVGVLSVAGWVADAQMRVNTSRRFELEVVPLAIVFCAGALLAFGAIALRRSYAPGIASLVVGATLAALVLTSRPVVECTRGGTATSGGPWWVQSAGTTSSGSGTSSGRISAGGSQGIATGRIERGDLLITYACSGSEVTELRMERR